MAGFASILGLLLQVVLVVIVARLIFAWWRGRHISAFVAARAGKFLIAGHQMGRAANKPPATINLWNAYRKPCSNRTVPVALWSIKRRAALKFLYSSNGAELSLFGLCAEATG
jgi:apolipoprotein N-acyltransferase